MIILSWNFSLGISLINQGEKSADTKARKAIGAAEIKSHLLALSCNFVAVTAVVLKRWRGGGGGTCDMTFWKGGPGHTSRTHVLDGGPPSCLRRVNSASLNNKEGEQKTSMKADLYLNSRYCARDLYLTPESGSFFFVFSEAPTEAVGWGRWRGGIGASRDVDVNLRANSFSLQSRPF